MLKYYYLERVDSSGNDNYSSYDEHFHQTVNTLYIVDTANDQMVDIFNYLVSLEQEKFEDLTFTDEDDETVILDSVENIINLTDDKYKKSKKLKYQIRNNVSILFLAEYNKEYIPLIEWLIDKNKTENKYDENKNIVNSINFICFEVRKKTFFNEQKEKIYKKYIIQYEYSGNTVYKSNTTNTDPLSIYCENYKYENDKFYQYFSNNIDIDRYEYCYTNHHFTNNLYPEHMKYLKFNIDTFNQSLNNLTNNLVYLEVKSDEFNQPIDNLPITLEYLTIESNKFNQSLDLLPIALKYLCIESNEFSQPINNLPINLEHLVLETRNFIHDFTNLPSSLISLEVNVRCKNEKIYDLTNLPHSLKSLYINGHHKHFSIDYLVIPPNLTHIYYEYIEYHYASEILEKYPNLQHWTYYQNYKYKYGSIF